MAAVETSAKSDDAIKTKTALIEWAKLIYNDKTITNLTQITEYSSAQLSQQIRQLNQVLYSPEKHTWHGKNLLVSFNDEQSLKNKTMHTPSSVLKPLYNK